MNPRTIQLQAASEKLAGCNVHKMHIAVSRQPNDRGTLGGSTKGVPSDGCIFCNS
jgi:hypothetical protein